MKTMLQNDLIILGFGAVRSAHYRKAVKHGYEDINAASSWKSRVLPERTKLIHAFTELLELNHVG
jgi:hypothetical protein